MSLRILSTLGATVAAASLALGENPAIVSTTLNPLPASVNIPASVFAGTFISAVDAPATASVYYAGSGDLTGDGYPEIVMTGWTYRGWDAAGTPPEAPLRLFSTHADGMTQIDGSDLLGITTLPGTTQPRIVDLNRDGRNDFFYLGHNESPFVPTISEIFLQNANGTFARSLLAGPKIESHNSNLGDFNGDGYPDIVASTYGIEMNFYADKYASGALPDPTHPDWSYLMLYLNDQTGKFAAYPLVTKSTVGDWLENVGSGSASALGDFDGDGNTDVVLVDGFEGASGWTSGDSWIVTNIAITNGVARGDLKPLPAPYFDRDGTYNGFPTAFGNDQSHDIKVDVLDLNGDGRPDIVVSSIIWDGGAGTTGGVFQVLLNRGGFQFDDVTDTHLHNFFLGAGSSHQTQFVDVNGDGFPDLLGSDPYGNAHAVSNGNGTETWTSNDQTWATRILINTGTGKFVQAMWNEFRELTLSQAALAGGLFVNRFDNIVGFYLLPDGRLGFLARQNGHAPEQGPKEIFFDFRATRPLSTGPHGTNPAAQGVPGFSEYYYLTEHADARAAVAGGVYASGLAHYLAVGRALGYRTFAANARIVGAGGFDTLTIAAPRAGFVVRATPDGVELDDNHGAFGRLTLVGIERVQFTDELLALGGGQVRADFDGDGKSDILWTNTATGERSVWLMNGTVATGGAGIGTVPVEWEVSATADYNGDGKSDLFWTNTMTGDRAVWLMNGTSVATNGFLGTVPPGWKMAGSGDFNGDGKADVLWSNTATGDCAIWLMDGTTAQGGGFLTTLDVAWQVRGTADYDGDGKADILWSNTQTGERAMWLMNGTVAAGGAVIGAVPVEWEVSASADYNGDGKGDILWTNTATGDRAIWLMSGTAVATNGFLGTVPVGWKAAAAGDYNGDSKADILWFNPVSGDCAMWLMDGATPIGGGFLTTLPTGWQAVP